MYPLHMKLLEMMTSEISLKAWLYLTENTILNIFIYTKFLTTPWKLSNFSMLAVYWKNNSQFVGNNQTYSLESSRFQQGLYKLRFNYNITAVFWFFSTFFGSNAHKWCLPRSYYIRNTKSKFSWFEVKVESVYYFDMIQCFCTMNLKISLWKFYYKKYLFSWQTTNTLILLSLHLYSL